MSLQKNQILPLTAGDLCNPVDIPDEKNLKTCDGYFVRWVRVSLDSHILWLIWGNSRSLWVNGVSLVCVEPLALGRMGKNNFHIGMVVSHTLNHSPAARTLQFKPDADVKWSDA